MRASKLAQVHEQAAQRQGLLDVAAGQGCAGFSNDLTREHGYTIVKSLYHFGVSDMEDDKFL